MIVGAYRRAAGAILTIAVASALALAGSSAAGAVGANEVGVFPTWTMAGSAGSFTGTASFASSTVPSPDITSDSVSVRNPSGESAYLGASTAFGQEFGSTRRQPYLTLRPQSASPAPTPPSLSTPPQSTTTIDFGSQQPVAGWGFALGDIDADWAFIQAYDQNGTLLPTGVLGAQAPGNYCDNASPKPSVCSGTAAPFDVPTWVPGPGTLDRTYAGYAISWAPGTIVGNVNDTSGAYIWFKPDANVRKVTIIYGALAGSPVYQLWVASPAAATTITGTVAIEDAPPGTAVPAGTVADLNNADGTPVLAIDETPVTVPVQPDGTYTFTTEQRPSYQIAIDPPPGYTAPAPVTVVANRATVAAPPVVVVAPPVVTPPPTSPPTTPSPTPTASITPELTLAATGADIAPWGFGAAALVVLGALVLAIPGLNRRRERTRAQAAERIR